MTSCNPKRPSQSKKAQILGEAPFQGQKKSLKKYQLAKVHQKNQSPISTNLTTSNKAPFLLKKLSSRSSASLPLVSAVLMSLASCDTSRCMTRRKPVPTTRLLWCCDDMNHRRWYDTGVQRRQSCSHPSGVEETLMSVLWPGFDVSRYCKVGRGKYKRIKNFCALSARSHT